MSSTFDYEPPVSVEGLELFPAEELRRLQFEAMERDEQQMRDIFGIAPPVLHTLVEARLHVSRRRFSASTSSSCRKIAATTAAMERPLRSPFDVIVPTTDFTDRGLRRGRFRSKMCRCRNRLMSNATTTRLTNTMIIPTATMLPTMPGSPSR